MYLSYSLNSKRLDSNLKRFSKIFFLAFSVLFFTFSVNLCRGENQNLLSDPVNCFTFCGDANGDGLIQPADLTLLFDYLYDSAELPCPENMDLDSFTLITLRDVTYLSRFLYKGIPALSTYPPCLPNYPAFEPVPDWDDTISIKQGIILPANAGSVEVPVVLTNWDSIYSLELPVRIRIGGAVPQIDSIRWGNANPADLKGAIVDAQNGTVDLGLHWINGLPPGKDTLFPLSLSMTPQPHPRVVRLDTLTPAPEHQLILLRYLGLEGTVPALYGFGPIPLYVQAFSPVNLIVIDPNEDSIGIDFNTIGNATYAAYNDSIHILEALPGNYFIKVVKDTSDHSGDSTYGVDARIDGTVDNAISADTPVPQEGEEHNYVITSQPGLPECLSKPGDANGNSFINLADIISIANYVFKINGCLPLPDCWLWGLNCRGDWNGNGSISTSDAVAGVNYVFGKLGGPWTPVPTGACCLPVE